MKSWMEGYNSDVVYTAGYFKELSPEYLNICSILANNYPIDLSKPFIYCELGCGNGLSLLVNASLFPNGTFYGVDYNPSHIAHARLYAEEAGLKNIHFFEKSFQELVDDSNLLPECDYIVFHGIYTWVNDKNRNNLIKICKRHLKPGGLVYNSYNAKPGRIVGEVLQKIIFQLSQEYPGNSIQKIDNVIKTLENLKEFNSGFFKLYEKELNSRLEKIKTSEKHYVVHEYLNEGWKSFYFNEVAEEMEEAKLNFLCNARPSEIYFSKFLPDETKKKLNDIKNDKSRELLKDMILFRGFRRDIYIKGSRRYMDNYEKIIWFVNKEWMLIKSDINEEFEFKYVSINIKGNKQIYGSIIEHLKNSIKSTKKLQELTGIEFPTLIQSLIILYDNSIIAIYNSNKKNNSIELNRVIANNVFNESNFRYVVSPNINFAAKIDNINLTWLKGLYLGFKTKDSLVNFAYNFFNSRGIAITKDGNHLTGESMKKRLYELFEEWQQEILPLWQKCGVVPNNKIKKHK